MRREYLQVFAAFFSFLILLQDTHALVRRNVYNKVNDDFDKATDDQIRAKRFVGTALVVIAAGSAALDIYKQEAGCIHVTPDLQPTINKGKQLNEEILTLKDNINLAWVPVESKERYAKILASDMNIFREQLTTFNALQTDIITLLDNKILTKMDQFKRELQNNIGRNNVTDVPDFEALEAKFMTPLQYGVTLTLKLAPVGIFLGVKYLLPKITARFASGQAADMVQSNPSLKTKMINTYAEMKGKFSNWKAEKIASFKANMNAKWTNFQTKHPKISGVLKKVTMNRFTKGVGKFVQTHKTKLVNAGKGVVVAFFVGYEIYNMVQFYNDCKTKYSEALKGLAALQENKKNLTLIMNDIHQLGGETEKYYGYMKGNITSDEYINFIKDIIALGRNSENQRTELADATENIQKYVDQIKEADYDKTDQLNKMVITALGKINYKLDCLRSKLSIVAGVRDGCATGAATFDKLFEDAKSREKKIVDTCINQNYMTKSGLQETTAETMKLQNLQPICIRNNPTKKTLACTNWYDDMSDDENMRKVGDVSIEDIKFFVSTCPPAPVTEVTKGTICQKKRENTVLSVILELYIKYDQAAVRLTYNNCELSSLQKESLCNMKRNGFTLENVQAKFTLYNPTVIKQVFDNCPKLAVVEPNTLDHKMICNYRGRGWTPDDPVYGFLYDGVRAKYTDAAIANVVCPGQGDNFVDSNNDFLNFADIDEKKVPAIV